MTWRELIYMAIDITKQISDDSQFNEDHIVFLAAKYRNYILNSQYVTGRKTVNDANYQLLKVPLQVTQTDICPTETLLKSKHKIPFMMTLGQKVVYPTDRIPYKSHIVWVPFNRFPYTGNKFSNSTIYASLGGDNYLYLRSSNENFLYLRCVTVKALWEDIAEVSRWDADACGCDIMDIRFPLEDAWVNTLLTLIVTDITKGIYSLRDTDNDAFDATDSLARAISRYTNTAFKNIAQGVNRKSDTTKTE